MLLEEYKARRSNKRVATILAIIGLTILLLAAVGSTFSLWFLSGLIPFPEHAEAVFGLRREAASIFLIDQVERKAPAPDVSTGVALFSRYVVVRHEDTYTVVGIPFMSQQRRAVSALEAAGWKVERFAWVVEARRQTGGGGKTEEASPLSSRWMRGYGSFLTESIRTKAAPLAFAAVRPGSYPFIDRPYSFVAVKEEERIAISAGFNTLEFPDTLSLRAESNEATSNIRGLFVSLPSSVLSFIPEDLATQVERGLSTQLGLTRTKPAILQELTGSHRIVLVNDERATALGIQGSRERVDTFIEVAQRWFAQERAYETPVQQAFRLPDGTVGFEYVPGDPENPFIENHTANHDCSRAEINAMISVWLCRTHEVAAIATSLEGAQSALGKLQEDTWRVVWQNSGENYLKGTDFTKFDRIEAFGTSTHAHISIFPANK